MQEVWKDIINYEGLYQVSNKGNVRRITKDGYREIKPSNRLYQDVDLCKRGEHHRQPIHRLVALHFIPNPSPRTLTEVNHIDGNKHNNNTENLEWVSQDQNREHAKKVLRAYPFGKKPRAVYKIDFETDEILDVYDSVSKAGVEFGNSYARVGITNCCKGRVKSAYGYKWQYAE